MAVELRMIGEPDEIARVVHEMEKVLDVAVSGRSYEARGRFGVRTYAEVRLPSPTTVIVEASTDPAHPATPAVGRKTARRELR